MIFECRCLNDDFFVSISCNLVSNEFEKNLIYYLNDDFFVIISCSLVSIEC